MKKIKNYRRQKKDKKSYFSRAVNQLKHILNYITGGRK